MRIDGREYRNKDLEEGVLLEMDLPKSGNGDDRIAQVCVLLLGQGQICVGPKGSQRYTDEWMYEYLAEALAALVAWDPETAAEPDGWVRHKSVARPGGARRRPEGDASREWFDAGTASTWWST